MKFVNARPYAQPEAAARKLVEIAAGIKPMQEDRIFIELVNWPFLTEFKGSPPEFGAGLRYAIEHGWFWMHESGTYLRVFKLED
jgi:hypothetical protein